MWHHKTLNRAVKAHVYIYIYIYQNMLHTPIPNAVMTLTCLSQIKCVSLNNMLCQYAVMYSTIIFFLQIQHASHGSPMRERHRVSFMVSPMCYYHYCRGLNNITKYWAALQRHMTICVSIYLLPLYQWYASHNYVCQPKTIFSENTQWSAVIIRSFFLQMLTTGIPWLAHDGEAWGVVNEFMVWPRCCWHYLQRCL